MGETRLRLLRAWLLLEDEEFEKGINSQWAKKGEKWKNCNCINFFLKKLNLLKKTKDFFLLYYMHVY